MGEYYAIRESSKKIQALAFNKSAGFDFLSTCLLKVPQLQDLNVLVEAVEFQHEAADVYDTSQHGPRTSRTVHWDLHKLLDEPWTWDRFLKSVKVRWSTQSRGVAALGNDHHRKDVFFLTG